MTVFDQAWGVVKAEESPDLHPDFARYVFEHIHNTGAYQPHIKGSVIPFIRQTDLDRVITEQMQQMWGGQE